MALFVIRFLLISEPIVSSYPNSITVQYAGDAASLESMGAILATINPDLTIVSFKSLDCQVADNFSRERLISRLTGLFGAVSVGTGVSRPLWNYRGLKQR